MSLHGRIQSCANVSKQWPFRCRCRSRRHCFFLLLLSIALLLNAHLSIQYNGACNSASNLCDFAWMHFQTTTQMTLLIIICACVWVYYHFYQNNVNLWTCPYMRALLSSHYMMLFALTKQCNRMEICINLFFLPFAWLFVQYKVNFRWNEQWWWWTPVQSEIRIPFSNGPRNRCVGRLWKLPKFWTLFYIFM